MTYAPTSFRHNYNPRPEWVKTAGTCPIGQVALFHPAKRGESFRAQGSHVSLKSENGDVKLVAMTPSAASPSSEFYARFRRGLGFDSAPKQVRAGFKPARTV
jgi:hypothetical protein